MPSWLVVILVAIAAVGLFVLGLSITIIVKGHFIDSEISTNKNMQKLGIKCAVQETREDMGLADCDDDAAGCSGNCSACDIEHSADKKQ
ncbi:MAG: hypothetical protein IJW42_00725 [Alistipes sp.]|nr:hypothetical protein [Alistipes sp.]